MTDISVKLYEWYSFLPENGKERVLLGDAMDEINRLRSTIEKMRAVSGLAIEGKPFSEIKKEICGPLRTSTTTLVDDGPGKTKFKTY